MVESQVEIKIIDLGHGRKLKRSNLADSSQRGNPLTAAPEVLFNDCDFYMPNQVGADQRADVWSLGITLFQMVTGVFPFSGYSRNLNINPREVLNNQVSCGNYYYPSFLNISPRTIKFINACIQYDYK